MWPRRPHFLRVEILLLPPRPFATNSGAEQAHNGIPLGSVVATICPNIKPMGMNDDVDY